MPAYAVAQTEIGLAIETIRGTPVAPAFWFKVKSPKYKPNLTLIEDVTLQGSMVQVYDMVPGLRYDAHSWDSNIYLDAFPILLRAMYGSTDTLVAAPANTTLAASSAAGAATISTAATLAVGSWFTVGTGVNADTRRVTAVSGAGPFTITPNYPMSFAHGNGVAVTGLTGHKFSLLNNAGTGNQPPSVTITDYDGEEWRQLAAAQLDKLHIKGNATGLAEYSASWFANASITPSAPTPSFTTNQAAPGWALIVAVNNVALTYVVDWEFDFARGVKPIPALTGTQAYYQYFAGPIMPTGKITVVEQTAQPELTQYENGTQLPIDLLLVNLSSGFALNIHSTLAEFKTGELDRSKEWVQATLDIQLLPTATDALAGGVSPGLMTVANSQTTQY